MIRVGIALMLLPAAFAQPVPVLAELFTSEGCSSCPPADALLRDLGSRQPVPGAHIVVLSEHVDYWNDLGWRDPYSSPQFSRRQKEYARMLDCETYTPQLVIDGREQMNGAAAAVVHAAVKRAAARPKIPIRIRSARREGREAIIEISIDPQPKRPDIWIAIADESDRSSVKRGENAGRTLDHVAIVRTLVKLGTLRKSEKLQKTFRLPAGRVPARAVVFLQDSRGQVLGAASTPIR